MNREQQAGQHISEFQEKMKSLGNHYIVLVLDS